jgi:hypothetical protein
MTHRLRLTSDAIDSLIVTTDPWLSCDDCFDQLDDVVEGLLTRACAMDEAFRVHLEGCAACRDEAISLATLIAPDHDLDPGHAATLLEAAVRSGKRPSRP